MNLYNALLGKNDKSGVLLAMLGITEDAIPRFRDCFVKGDKIVIYTRTGGGNRTLYDNEESCRTNHPDYFVDGETFPGPWNDGLRANKYYVSDDDDDFDCTYANFYFRFPDEYADELKVLGENSDMRTSKEKWAELFKMLRKMKRM